MLYLMMEKLVDMLEEAKGDLVAELEIYKAMIGYLKIKPAEAQEKSDIEMIRII
ncbi:MULTISPECIES: hypothetical protein [Campylobacter]|uniref:Uncharacterized protein n=1 Tax=Campylobacter vicugnae TaxID=1660076 RepID=A0ABZ2E8E1_9BACT|nr:MULTISPECIES: hypothetical protein [unclassified Campylobacter]ARR03390.1 hypothetical protein CVIC12175_0241 [Campylobacter sp. RM12175]MCR8690791.1 hypothetical protein [Campylobacter sp. RM9264]MCR8701829.1 hypothetical protein [Campylobacter sp. RM12176]